MDKNTKNKKSLMNGPFQSNLQKKEKLFDVILFIAKNFLHTSLFNWVPKLLLVVDATKALKSKQVTEVSL